MKIAIYSDLHFEFSAAHRGFAVPPTLDADVIVAAGDVYAPGLMAPEILSHVFRAQGQQRELVFVPGNHEFYRAVHATERERMAQTARDAGVHLLDGSSVVIGGVRILGATLWTDYRLPVLVDGELVSDQPRAMSHAARRLNDHRLILLDEGPKPRRLAPSDALELHQLDRDWLRSELARPFDGPTVVVTHHAPRLESVHANYVSDWLSPAFASHLDDSFFAVPTLWIHGHVHDSFDYRVGRCRVIANPRGYPLPLLPNRIENEAFDPALVIDI